MEGHARLSRWVWADLYQSLKGTAAMVQGSSQQAKPVRVLGVQKNPTGRVDPVVSRSVLGVVYGAVAP